MAKNTRDLDDKSQVSLGVALARAWNGGSYSTLFSYIEEPGYLDKNISDEKFEDEMDDILGMESDSEADEDMSEVNEPIRYTGSLVKQKFQALYSIIEEYDAPLATDKIARLVKPIAPAGKRVTESEALAITLTENLEINYQKRALSFFHGALLAIDLDTTIVPGDKVKAINRLIEIYNRFKEGPAHNNFYEDLYENFYERKQDVYLKKMLVRMTWVLNEYGLTYKDLTAGEMIANLDRPRPEVIRSQFSTRIDNQYTATATVTETPHRSELNSSLYQDQYKFLDLISNKDKTFPIWFVPTQLVKKLKLIKAYKQLPYSLEDKVLELCETMHADFSKKTEHEQAMIKNELISLILLIPPELINAMSLKAHPDFDRYSTEKKFNITNENIATLKDLRHDLLKIGKLFHPTFDNIENANHKPEILNGLIHTLESLKSVPMWFLELQPVQQHYLVANKDNLDLPSLPATMRGVPGLANMNIHESHFTFNKANQNTNIKCKVIRHGTLTPYSIDFAQERENAALPNGKALAKIIVPEAEKNYSEFWAPGVMMNDKGELFKDAYIPLAEISLMSDFDLVEDYAFKKQAKRLANQGVAETVFNLRPTKLFGLNLNKIFRESNRAMRNENREAYVKGIQSHESAKKFRLFPVNLGINGDRWAQGQTFDNKEYQDTTKAAMREFDRVVSYVDPLMKMKKTADKPYHPFNSVEAENKYKLAKLATKELQRMQEMFGKDYKDSSADERSISNRINAELFANGLYSIIIQGMGGTVSACCKSTKDRTGLFILHQDAMHQYYTLTGELIPFAPKDNSPESIADYEAKRAHFVDIMVDLFMANTQQYAASQATFGAAGIKKPKGGASILQSIAFAVLFLTTPLILLSPFVLFMSKPQRPQFVNTILDYFTESTHTLEPLPTDFLAALSKKAPHMFEKQKQLADINKIKISDPSSISKKTYYFFTAIPAKIEKLINRFTNSVEKLKERYTRMYNDLPDANVTLRKSTSIMASMHGDDGSVTDTIDARIEKVVPKKPKNN